MSYKFITIPIGIDINLFKPRDIEEKYLLRKSLGFKINDNILIFVGRLCYEKNIASIIDTFKEYLEIGGDGLLVIIGDGNTHDEIQLKISNLNLNDKVRIIRNLSREKLSNYLQIADLFVMASLYEGLPTAALEAMACGVPVMTTNTGELPSLINDEKNGKIIYTLKDYPSELIRALGKNNNRGWTANSGNSCREKATLYSWDIISKQVEEYYLDIYNRISK